MPGRLVINFHAHNGGGEVSSRVQRRSRQTLAIANRQWKQIRKILRDAEGCSAQDAGAKDRTLPRRIAYRLDTWCRRSGERWHIRVIAKAISETP